MRMVLTATIEIDEPVLLNPGGGTREQKLRHMRRIAERLEGGIRNVIAIADEPRVNDPDFSERVEDE